VLYEYLMPTMLATQSTCGRGTYRWCRRGISSSGTAVAVFSPTGGDAKAASGKARMEGTSSVETAARAPLGRQSFPFTLSSAVLQAVLAAVSCAPRRALCLRVSSAVSRSDSDTVALN
jgi:hypothetical protein